MPLNLPQPLRVWNHQQGDTYDLNASPLTSAGYSARYVQGKRKRVIGGREYAHPNVHGDAAPGGPERVNQLIVNGQLSTVPGLQEALTSLGFTPGELLSQVDWMDMDHFIEAATYDFLQAGGGWRALSGDFPVLYRIHIPWHRATVGAVTPPAPTQPPLSTGDQGSELYESGHEISAKLPKATKIRRAVGAFETCWGGINAAIAQAKEDNVPPSEDILKAAREGLLIFFDALNAAFQEGRDFIFGAEAEECQLACDRVWDAFHEARRVASGAKATGWELVAGDPRRPVFKYSRYNRICWTALSNLTTAAGLYGLRGELQSNGTRAAEYVDAFESWDSQDPLREMNEGDGGINLPGPSFEEATEEHG